MYSVVFPGWCASLIGRTASSLWKASEHPRDPGGEKTQRRQLSIHLFFSLSIDQFFSLKM